MGLVLRLLAYSGMCLSAWPADPVSFNRDIRPLMSDTCFRCHGPDKGTRMAGLRLDLREEAIKPNRQGMAPIVPGDPDKSLAIQRVFATSKAKLMPPEYAHKELTLKQKNLLRQWVAEGAKYDRHWSYEPVTRPAVPQSAAHPIDAFIQQRLARESLQLSPEAGRRTLIRRVSLDLTGLPPTPAEVSAFLADRSHDAYQKVVDRLLASPAYAEKQTMHWLDVVRYADTSGFHGDNPFPAWPYRDYVLKSFRDNKPFDQFTREQLAGDLLPGGKVEYLVASAYNRMNRTSAEGGVQPKEYLAKYGADRVRTTSAVWLGATMGCAECHDHKFDPITAKDFYSFKAFFADIKETGLVPDRGPKAWGSQIELPAAEQRARKETLTKKLESLRAELNSSLESRTPEIADWQKRMLAEPSIWTLQHPVSARSVNGAELKIYNDEPFETMKSGDGLIVASGPNPDRETYIVELKPGAGRWTTLGLEVLQDDSLPGARVARGAGRLAITEIDASPHRFSLAESSVSDPSGGMHPMAAIDGDSGTAWGVATYGESGSLMLALRFAQPLNTMADTVLTVRIKQESSHRRATLGRFRLALSPLEYAAPVIGRRAKPRIGDKQYAWARENFQPLLASLSTAEAELVRLNAEIPRVVVTETNCPQETRLLPRGDWMNDTGPVVEPAIPAFLGKTENEGRATRLDLANWLVSRSNPLTARVFVNRLWRQFFGAGLSKVLDDLGSQGELPSHPELLDWLAAEFMQNWDVKHVVRTIVTSRTYRQSSQTPQALLDRDPENRLLARQSRYRVEAETVRDIALSVSGLLAERFGGPSVYPYQPDNYLAALNFPRREYSASYGPDLYRRGLYTFWQRTFLHPSLLTFDASSREECTVNRSASNTPLQALVLLNDPIFVEAARVFAQNISASHRTFPAQLDAVFLAALSRKPLAEELTVLSGLYRQNLARFRKDTSSASDLLSIGEYPLPANIRKAELAALMTVTRAVLNLHEAITRN